MNTRDPDPTESGQASRAVELVPLVYSHLRSLASTMLSKEPPGATLQATALVNEAVARLMQRQDPEWQSREHFFNAAALAMRRILVDRARRAVVRGEVIGEGDLDRIAVPAARDYRLEEYEALDSALSALCRENERCGQVVHLRYFLGLSIEQTAECLGVSTRTVKDDWQFARAWLRTKVDMA